MRNVIFLLTITALVAFLAGCASPQQKQASANSNHPENYNYKIVMQPGQTDKYIGFSDDGPLIPRAQFRVFDNN